MEEADKEGLGNITYKDFLALCKELVEPRLVRKISLNSINFKIKIVNFLDRALNSSIFQ